MVKASPSIGFFDPEIQKPWVACWHRSPSAFIGINRTISLIREAQGRVLGRD